MNARFSSAAFAGALLVFVVVGCNAVLGIEAATVDPTLAGDASVQVGEATNDCSSYCAIIKRNCGGDNLEYTSDKACLELCSHFDTGRPGDQSGDSLACRVFHTNAAATDPNVHCRHAGPLGGGHCGEPCNAFCLLDFAVCGDRPPYASEAECRKVCATYPYLTSGPGVGDVLIQDGPTLNCRMYHLESAVENPATHCPHTSLSNVHCTPPETDAGPDAAH